MRDPGLQPERTGLAWRRTGLSLAAAAGVIARRLTIEPWDWRSIVVAVTAAAALGCGLAASSRAGRSGWSARGCRAGLLWFSAAVVLLAVGECAAALIELGPKMR